jgi:hypothetical protein
VSAIQQNLFSEPEPVEVAAAFKPLVEKALKPEVLPPPPAIEDLESDWMGFLAKHNRVPMIQDARKPWTYRGWLMHYRLAAEDLLSHLHPPRWDYWTRTMLAGKILDEPIPQLHVTDYANDRSAAYKNFDDCIHIIDNHTSSPVFNLLCWLSFGLGIRKICEVQIEDRLAERLYRTFNLEWWLKEPHDYIGLWIAEHKGTWNPTAFFPTPHSVCEMMTRMTFGEEDMRSKTVNDPAVGTGRFLLHASNFSLRLSGNDIDRTVLEACLVNGALYCPWMVRPFPEAWFNQEEICKSAG